MKVFVTGASGFVGSAVVKELLSAGHQVIGLARSEQSAKIVSEAGAEVLMGSLEDLDTLKQGASEADGVIHAAFSHDFTDYLKASELDKTAINTMCQAMLGTAKPIVVTAGILGLEPIEGAITEESSTANSPRLSEATALALAEKGVHASVVRFPPSVHDKGDKGFVPFLIQLARNKGVAAYLEGNIRWSSVHRLDAARAFRLAVEKSAKGAVYNVIGDNGIALRDMALLIGEKLNVPIKSLKDEEIDSHFDWMGRFIRFDSYATNQKTKELLDWEPTHIGLLEDMEENYF